MTSNSAEPKNNSSNKKIETIQVTLTLSKQVLEICRLLCKFEFNDDFDHYVSQVVTQDALNVKKSGDCGIFQEYAKKIYFRKVKGDIKSDGPIFCFIAIYNINNGLNPFLSIL